MELCRPLHEVISTNLVLSKKVVEHNLSRHTGVSQERGGRRYPAYVQEPCREYRGPSKGSAETVFERLPNHSCRR